MPSKKHIAVVLAIGIDTGKNTLHMIGLDEKGTIVLREKVSRGRVAARLVNVPPCLIGIEAGMVPITTIRPCDQIQITLNGNRQVEALAKEKPRAEARGYTLFHSLVEEGSGLCVIRTCKPHPGERH